MNLMKLSKKKKKKNVTFLNKNFLAIIYVTFMKISIFY